MFVVLKITERKSGGVLNGLYNLLVKPGIYLETRECPGTRFALIKAESVNGKPNWTDIEKICGAYAGRVLLPEGINAPEGSKIKNPALPAFNSRILVRTACKIIELSRMPMYRRVLGLIDLDGAHSDTLCELLAHYTSVRVVTKNIEKYEAEARRVMDEIGAPVTLSESFDCLNECVLVLSPSALYTKEEIKASCPVIAGEAFVCAQRLNLVTALRITPGKRLLEACPEGIEPHLFAGAVFEFCGTGVSKPEFYDFDRTSAADSGRKSHPKGVSSRQDWGGFVADRMVFDYREADISDVVRAVIECNGLKRKSAFYPV